MNHSDTCPLPTGDIPLILALTTGYSRDPFTQLFFLVGLWVPGGQECRSFISSSKCWSWGLAHRRCSGEACSLGVLESQSTYCKQGSEVAVSGLEAELGVWLDFASSG